MGTGKIFSRGGALVDSSKNISRGDKSGEICLLPLETKKTAFLVKFSNSCPFPTRPVTSLGHQGRRRVF